MMNWGYKAQTSHDNDEENGYRFQNRPGRESHMIPIPRYGHPYASTIGNEDGDNYNDMWGACLGVLICMFLLFFLLFAMSYPAQYYYNSDNPAFKNNYQHSGICPSCWM
jgi:hypothetical protein